MEYLLLLLAGGCVAFFAFALGAAKGYNDGYDRAKKLYGRKRNGGNVWPD